MKIWNKSLIQTFFILSLIILVVGFLLGFFIIYPVMQPNAFSFAEVFIGAEVITLLLIFSIFTKGSCWSFEINEGNFVFNKIFKKIKITISDIKQAKLEITVDYAYPSLSDGQIFLELPKNQKRFYNVWYPIIFQIGEILNKSNIKATYELCVPSKESKMNVDCKNYSSEEFDKFKAEVFKRLGNINVGKNKNEVPPPPWLKEN